MDKLQNQILEALSEDSRLTAEKLALMTGAKPDDIAKKISQMEQSGVIVKYNTVINTEKLEKECVEALIEVKVSPECTMGFDGIAEKILQFPAEII